MARPSREYSNYSYFNKSNSTQRRQAADFAKQTAYLILHHKKMCIGIYQIELIMLLW